MGIFPVGDSQYDAILARESALVDAAELIAEALERSGLNQSQLARLLGVGRSEITARLRGTRNMTVKSLAETLHAMDCRLQLSLEESDDSERPSSSLDGWRPATWFEGSSHEANRGRRVASQWVSDNAID